MTRRFLPVGALVTTALLVLIATWNLEPAARLALTAAVALTLLAGLAGRRQSLVTVTVIATAAVVAITQALDRPSAMEAMGWAVGLGLTIEASLHAGTGGSVHQDDRATKVRSATPVLAAVAAPPIAAVGLGLVPDTVRPAQGWAVVALSALLVGAVAVLVTLAPRDLGGATGPRD